MGRILFRDARLLSVVTACFGALALAGASSGKQPFQVKGQYVEGCSCMGVCPCELTGLKNGCQGVGAMALTGGRYQGVDLTGTKIAYATVPGQWVRLYVDPKTPKQRAAAQAFARAAYTPFGKVESVKDANIAFGGTGGRYTVSVDGGRVMHFTTVPVMGGDNRSPIIHANVKDLLNPTMMQGKTVSASYKDGDRSFTLAGTNSYFNPRMSRGGRL